MEELDLSFATTDQKKAEEAIATGGLDLSFATKEKVSTQEPKRSIAQSIGDVFTGNDRETEATETLPEFDLPAHFALTRPIETAKTALGFLTTFDDKKQLKILKANFPKITFSEDEKGSIIVDATAEGGEKGILNMPGISTRDLMQLGFQVAAFAPAKAATGAGLVKGALQVGGKAGVIQTTQDLTSQATGREDDVSLKNVQVGDVALASGLGAGFQMLFKPLASIAPALRKQIAQTGITDEIRTIVRDTAVRLGLNADDITDDVIEGVLRQADESVSPQQSFATQGEREFGVPLTAGQRSLDDAQLSAEDAMRAGARGESAQRIVRGFEQEQQVPAINRARDQLANDVGGAADGQGGIVRDSVRAAEREADNAVSQAFEEVGEVALTPDGMSSLLKSTRQAVRGVEFDPTLTQTANILKQVKSFENTIKTFKGKGLKPTDLNKVEQMRRRLNTAIGAADNPSDRRQVTLMKRAFDDALDDAVINSLFVGDSAALEALKGARGLFSEYARKFRANPIKGRSGRVVDRDEAGQFIERIIDANPTDEQVINAVFGASGLNKGAGRDMAIRFRTILGDDSPGWAAIRQAAFRRLIKTNTVNGQEVISGQKTIKAINDAIEKNGSLMSELFTPEEVGTIRRFAAQVKRTQPDLVKSRENPSGTAQALTKTVADFGRRISQALAFSGEPLFFVSSKGVQTAKGFRNAAQAKNAVKPFELVDAKPELVSGATAAGITAQ